MKRNSITIWFAGYAFFGLMWAFAQASKAQDASAQPREIWHLRQPPTASPGFYVISSSGDGQLLAARDRDNIVYLFDLEQQKKWLEFKGHETNWIESIEFSPEGERFLTAAGSGEKLKVWRTDNGQLEFEIPTTTSRASFSVDGGQIIALGSRQVEFFSVPSGLVKGVSNWQLSNETAVTMSRDGKLVVMQRRLNPQVYSLELLNLQSKLRIGLPGDTARPSQIVVSPDKQWIAGSFENGNRLHLWHSFDPRDRHYVLDGHDGIIGAIAFSSDGRFLVSADDRRKVIAWDVLTRQSVSKFETGQSAIRSIAFLPQPFRVAIGGITDSQSSIWIGELRPVILRSNQACPDSMDLIWKQLGSTTASTSLDAASVLIEHFEKFQVELRETLFAATYERSDEELNNLLLQLSDQDFLRREQATRQLVERLSHFEVQLRQLVKNEDLPTEQRYRIRRILINQPRPLRFNVEVLRRWMRLILVLEMVGSNESRRSLERIALGHPDNEISGSASAALQRFDMAKGVVRD